MSEGEALTTKAKLTGFVGRLYLDPKTRGLVAGSIAMLGVPGKPELSTVGAGFSLLDNFLVAQLQQAESNRVYLSDRFEARTEILYDSGRLDEKAFEDPDYKGLAFQAMLAAAQETSQEKIDLIAAILAGAASTERPPDLNMRALLASISFLTIEEIRLARQFYEGIPEIQTFKVQGMTTPMWGPETDFYLKRLETANLVVPMIQQAPFPAAMAHGQYVVTGTFRRLMELIKQTEPSSES